MDIQYFRKVENLFVSLLFNSKSVLSETELREIELLVTVSEFGIALESYLFICNEDNKVVPPKVKSILDKLIDEMAVTDEGIVSAVAEVKVLAA